MAGGLMVHIDTATRPGALRLSVQGQLDLAAERVFSQALARAARFGRRIEIDLGQVDFIDGSGLSMLIDAECRARRSDRQLTIVNASRPVHRLIAITGLAGRLPPLAASESLAATADVEIPGRILAHRAIARAGP
jgi:anti-sigma B factor antagonist